VAGQTGAGRRAGRKVAYAGPPLVYHMPYVPTTTPHCALCHDHCHVLADMEGRKKGYVLCGRTCKPLISNSQGHRKEEEGGRERRTHSISSGGSHLRCYHLLFWVLFWFSDRFSVLNISSNAALRFTAHSYHTTAYLSLQRTRACCAHAFHRGSRALRILLHAPPRTRARCARAHHLFSLACGPAYLCEKHLLPTPLPHCHLLPTFMRMPSPLEQIRSQFRPFGWDRYLDGTMISSPYPLAAHCTTLHALHCTTALPPPLLHCTTAPLPTTPPATPPACTYTTHPHCTGWLEGRKEEVGSYLRS